MSRINNQLPNNLPQLQNLIKRYPASYKDEFLQQLKHYRSLKDLFVLKPSVYNQPFDELIMFLAQLAYCYPEDLSDYPQNIMDILQQHQATINQEIRMTMCRALIMLRNKNLLTPTVLLTLFFQLLRCQDKSLRKFLTTHIVTDIKNINSKSRNMKINNVLQNFMYGMLKDTNVTAAKLSLDIMIQLYKKDIWKDAKTVNVIATACFSKSVKIMVTALQFFVGSDVKEKTNSDEESDTDDDVETIKEATMANRFNKKTRRREQQLKKVKQMVKRNKKKRGQAPTFNFSALHLLHDPQSFAEKLFRQVETMNERFEVKILALDVVSRLIGVHQLFVFNFYPFLVRFLQPHQREVTRMLQFGAQASHELVPPDVLEPVLKAIVNNFVTERNSGEVMAVGLNAIKEMCLRCPLVMNEDLLQDLAQYKTYKDKSVMMASRSLITLFRNTNPELLHKKDRGRPTEAMTELKPLNYGEIEAKDFIPGAEALAVAEGEESSEEESDNESDAGSEGSWVDLNHDADALEESDDALSDPIDTDVEDEDSDEEEDEKIEDEDDNVKEEKDDDEHKSKDKKRKIKHGKSKNLEILKEKQEKAAMISISRILTDKDFAKIDAAQIRKQVDVTKKNNNKRKIEDEEKFERSELVSLDAIERVHKKRRHDKESRLATVMEGREDREKPGRKQKRQNPFASTTNKEKQKKKGFMMIRNKAKGKKIRSFKEKQVALRNALLKQKRIIK
ncbi:protein SDA1 homolog isoform X2 [Artemia franciscana]|uniref:protein SDA1 homolog isoform X2 n=1 Tax=Artemia franciscana TaxID=6661 RepID=UPI0032DA22BC